MGACCDENADSASIHFGILIIYTFINHISFYLPTQPKTDSLLTTSPSLIDEVEFL